MKKVIFLTGGSSGIGRAASASLQEAGNTVYELSRRDNAAPGVIHVTADITDEKRVREAIGEIYEKEGRIDVLINNAGFGISGACEFTENKEAKRLLEVNLFGAVNCSRAVLPIMRKAGHGRIVFLSSVAGEISIPFQGWYSISKASVLAFANALGNEVAPYGIEVTTVLPGDIASGFTAAREKSAAGDDEYGGRISRSVAVMEHDEQTGMTPAAAGKYIAGVALKNGVRPRYVIGAKYGVFTFLAKVLPTRLVKFIVGKMYAQ